MKRYRGKTNLVLKGREAKDRGEMRSSSQHLCQRKLRWIRESGGPGSRFHREMREDESFQ